MEDISARTVFSWIVASETTLIKILDKSAFLHRGTGIPRELCSFFMQSPQASGEATGVALELDGRLFDGRVLMDRQPIPRARLFWEADFSQVLRQAFPFHYALYAEDGDLQPIAPTISFTKTSRSGHYTLTLSHDDLDFVDFVQGDIQLEHEDWNDPLYEEGAVTQTTGKAYERNAVARAMALKIHGFQCRVCGFNFEERFGSLGRHFIEVHHVKPLHQAGGKTRQVNPATDLVPVCCNCHAMLHRDRSGEMTIERLRSLIQ